MRARAPSALMRAPSARANRAPSACLADLHGRSRRAPTRAPCAAAPPPTRATRACADRAPRTRPSPRCRRRATRRARVQCKIADEGFAAPARLLSGTGRCPRPAACAAPRSFLLVRAAFSASTLSSRRTESGTGSISRGGDACARRRPASPWRSVHVVRRVGALRRAAQQVGAHEDGQEVGDVFHERRGRAPPSSPRAAATPSLLHLAHDAVHARRRQHQPRLRGVVALGVAGELPSRTQQSHDAQRQPLTAAARPSGRAARPPAAADVVREAAQPLRRRRPARASRPAGPWCKSRRRTAQSRRRHDHLARGRPAVAPARPMCWWYSSAVFGAPAPRAGCRACRCPCRRRPSRRRRAAGPTGRPGGRARARAACGRRGSSRRRARGSRGTRRPPPRRSSSARTRASTTSSPRARAAPPAAARGSRRAPTACARRGS